MRKIFFLFVFLAFPLFVYPVDIPKPSGWVNDFAGVISPEYKDKINALIEELEQKTTAEIAVVTVNSISPYGEIEYARLLFDNWKPGKKGKDNGVLVLLAIKERRWRIETGYGIEGILPDGLCGEIGRNYMVPYFKEAKYGEGLYQGVIKLSQIIARNFNINLSIPEEDAGALNSAPLAAGIAFLTTLIILMIIPLCMALLCVSQRRRYGGWGYGGYGGGFGGGGRGGGGGTGGGF